ncbi:hypothetical protein M0805_002212 [Coniferiporia weirii]|nr:hypothetical protein M0805_002212 [Coniferiporia weirii]
MLLVQQAQHPSPISLMSPFPRHFAAHRRNPSAPAAVVQVQPTKVPGLLSLSKPPAVRPHANPANARHPTPRQPRAKPVQVPQDVHAEKEREKLRGRGDAAKDKPARNQSKPRAGHGGRARQPSPPPLSLPGQAPVEAVPVPISPKQAPNVAPSTPPSSIHETSPLLSAPSGRLAKRRNRGPIPFSTSAPTLTPKAPKPTKRSQTPPAKVKPVVVPVKAEPYTVPISRSVPIFTPFSRTSARRGVADVFPVCDDNDDGLERPSTPSPTGRGSGLWQEATLFDSDGAERGRGPRTAPITTSAKHFFPSPSPSPHGEHKRAPSVPVDTIFGLSFESDNELSLSDASALPGRGSQRPRLDGSIRSMSTPSRNSGVIFNKYASSMFQNSPSPEHLPPPRFSLASMKKGLVTQH